MKRYLVTAAVASAAFIGAAGCCLAEAGEWSPVGNAMHHQGKLSKGGVYRIELPRTDLHVTVRGVRLLPALNLITEVSFARHGSSSMMMAELVLRDSEINPVITRLAFGGIEISALHTHVLGATPHVMWLHIMKMGDPVSTARAVRAALLVTGTPFKEEPSRPRKIMLNTAALDRILGHKGKQEDGIYAFSWDGPKVSEHGQVLPSEMDLQHEIRFQPTGAGRAAVNGEFILRASEVNPVIHALRQNGIEIESLHNHMLSEEPRVFFLHFWGYRNALALARGLHAAAQRIGSS